MMKRSSLVESPNQKVAKSYTNEQIKLLLPTPNKTSRWLYCDLIILPFIQMFFIQLLIYRALSSTKRCSLLAHLETKSILKGRKTTVPFQVPLCFSPVAASSTSTKAWISEVLSDKVPSSVLFSLMLTQP